MLSGVPAAELCLAGLAGFIRREEGSVPQPQFSENARLDALAMDIQAGSAKSASAFQEIKRSVRPRALDRYSRWGYSYLAPSDFDDLYGGALNLAISTFDRSKACIATWVIRQLKYACMEENRHRARQASLDRRELLQETVDENDPAKIAASADELHIMSGLFEQALYRESGISRCLLRAWHAGFYALDEVAKFLGRTVVSARRTRSRNLQGVRSHVRKHLPRP